MFGRVSIVILAAVLLAGCRPAPVFPASFKPAPIAEKLSPVQTKVIASLRDQLTWNTHYDNGYYRIAYPGGDLPRNKGACTDVVVRAYRSAGYDLQKLVHEDMVADWSAYPHIGGATKPDPNIDHRRTPNLMVYFKRHGMVLTKKVDASTAKDWQPGDIVCWNFGLDHVGVLSNRRNANGVPLVVHNMSQTLEEDVLTAWKITGHFRFPKS